MTQPARFELFSFWRTSATYRVRVAFNLKGISPLEHNINIDSGEHRSGAFLKLNPMGAIPALLDQRAAAFGDRVVLRKKERGLWKAVTWTALDEKRRAVAATGSCARPARQAS